MNICATVCNNLNSLEFRNSTITFPVGTSGSWSYSSAYQMSMTMTIGPAEFSAGVSTSGNLQTVTGTFYDTTTNLFTCTYVEELISSTNKSVCAKSTIPFTDTVGNSSGPWPLEFEISVSVFGMPHFFDMSIPLPPIYLKF